MFVELPDKVRIVDRENNAPGPPFVHSLEIGADFLTFFVKTPSRAQTVWLDSLDIEFASHDNARYHADDPNMSWVWECFRQQRFRNHHHVLTRDPKAIIEQLSISDEMKRLL